MITIIVFTDRIFWHSLVKKITPQEIMNSTFCKSISSFSNSKGFVLVIIILLAIIAIFSHEQLTINALCCLFIINFYGKNPSLWKSMLP